MEHTYQYLVGIDWGHEEHQVCILDPQGKRRQRRIPNTGQSLAELAQQLLALSPGAPEQIGVAIETPHGPVVETLLERGLAVYALNPKQLDRFRDRHTVAGAKDDRLDAYVLADSLRTDRDCFRRVQLDEPTIIQLREMTRMHQELTTEAVRLSNQVWAQLHRYWPELLQLCPAADEPWFWALWEQASTPQQGAGLSEQSLQQLLRQHRIRRLAAGQVRAVLQAMPVRVAPGVTEAASSVIALLLPRLRLVQQQQQTVQQRIDALLDQVGTAASSEAPQREHRDVEIFRSVTGAGRFVVATVFAEASQPLASRDYSILRAQAGVAPVTRQTGKQKSGKRTPRDRAPQVTMRYGCNAYLREAMHHWARVSAQHDPHSQAHYQRLRAAGHNHGRALRGVADRLLQMLVGMLKNGTLYDSQRRGRGTTGQAAAA